MSIQKKIIIIGAGGHATSVANVAYSAGYKICGFVDNKKAGQELLGHDIFPDYACLSKWPGCQLAIGIGDNQVRERIYYEINAYDNSIIFPTLVHEYSLISVGATIGSGTIIMPGAIIGPNSVIDNFCILNTKSSLDHDSQMMAFSSLAPGVTIGGNVKVGRRTAVSMGTVVLQGVSIGDDTVVGANSFLNKNLDNNVVAYGSPAKRVRTRAFDEPYLTV